MFGPGVSAMPSEMRPKANKLETSGVGRSCIGAHQLMPRCETSAPGQSLHLKRYSPPGRCDTALPNGGHDMRWQALQTSQSAPKPNQRSPT